MQDWQGLSVEFNNNDYTVYLLACSYNDHFLNCFIEVSGKVMNKLITEDEISSFMRLVGLVAVSIKSQGGFGTFELPFEPFAPEKAISYIFSNPENFPSLLGIIPFDRMEEDKLRKLATDEFKVLFSTLWFYFLEHENLR